MPSPDPPIEVLPARRLRHRDRTGRARTFTRMTDLFDRQVDEHGHTYERTVAQAAVDFVRQGVPFDLVAALVLVDRSTLYRWMSTGAAAHQRRLAGAKTRDLTTHQRNCLDFAVAMRQALAEAEARDIDALNKLAAGGYTTVTVTDRRIVIPDPNGGEHQVDAIERTVVTKTHPPDFRALAFRLSRRRPDRWGIGTQRDVDPESDVLDGVTSGPDEALDPTDEVLAELDAIHRRQAEASVGLGDVIDVTEADDTPLE